MNTLAARFHSETFYPIPHADFLRLQHAHSTGVLFLDMLDTLESTGQRPDAAQKAAFRVGHSRCSLTSSGRSSKPVIPTLSPAWRLPPHEHPTVLFTR